MPDFGAAPRARAQRIRAGILLPFWQDAFYRIQAAGHPDPRPANLARVQVLAMEILLKAHDREDLFGRTLASSEFLAQGLESPAPPPVAALIRKALPEKGKIAKPGTPTAFLYGVFREWLKAKDSELQLFRGADGVEVTIVGRGPSGVTFARSRVAQNDQLPARARAAGAATVREIFREVERDA